MNDIRIPYGQSRGRRYASLILQAGVVFTFLTNVEGEMKLRRFDSFHTSQDLMFCH